MLRIGLIGLGEVAQVVHLPVLASLPHLYEVRAACDLSPTLLDRVPARFGIPHRYPDAEEMIKAGGLDAVLVLNSDEYHAEVAITAMNHGLHVLVEKPMCLSPAEAEQIIEARDRTGRTVMVGYMRRFAPAFTEAVAMMGELGGVRFARVHDVIGRNRLIIDQTVDVIRADDLGAEVIAARQQRAAELVTEALGPVPDDLAGAYRLLCGLGSHDLSAMRELFGGPPQRVAAARHWRGGSYLAALLDYDDFVVSYQTGVDEQLRFDAHLEVYGEHTMLRIQYDSPYLRHLPTTLITETTSGDGLTRSVRRPHFKDPYTFELEYFHRAVTEGLAPKTSPEDFTADLDLFAQLIDAMKRSAP